MIDLIQKRKELIRSVEILADQVKDLVAYKKRLENSIIMLNRQASRKATDLKQVGEQFTGLVESIEKAKGEVDEYRRQEIEGVAEEVEKRRREMEAVELDNKIKGDTKV